MPSIEVIRKRIERDLQLKKAQVEHLQSEIAQLEQALAALTEVGDMPKDTRGRKKKPG